MKCTLTIDYDSDRKNPLTITKPTSPHGMHTAAWKNEHMQDVDMILAALVHMIEIAHTSQIVMRSELVKSCVKFLADAPYDPGYVPQIRQ